MAARSIARHVRDDPCLLAALAAGHDYKKFCKKINLIPFENRKDHDGGAAK